MDIFSVNPYIRVALRRSTLRPHSTIHRRIIFDYELLYVEAGRFWLTYGDKTYVCEQGSFVLLRPGIPHRFEMRDEALVQPHIHFDMTYAPDSREVPVSFRDRCDMEERELRWLRNDVFADYPPDPFIHFNRPKEALTLFYSILEAPHDATGQLTQKAHMIRLLSMLAEDNFPSCFARPETYTVERQIKDYIDSHQGGTMTLTDFEKQFSYSKFHIEKKFRQAYGVGVMAYRNQKRLEAARHLLAAHSVTAVAEMLGYRSIYSFSRAFKQHFGVSPSEEKKSM